MDLPSCGGQVDRHQDCQTLFDSFLDYKEASCTE